MVLCVPELSVSWVDPRVGLGWVENWSEMSVFSFSAFFVFTPYVNIVDVLLTSTAVHGNASIGLCYSPLIPRSYNKTTDRCVYFLLIRS